MTRVTREHEIQECQNENPNPFKAGKKLRVSASLGENIPECVKRTGNKNEANAKWGQAKAPEREELTNNHY
jgi:hypothetical protein